MSNLHNLFPNDVTLEPIEHKYLDTDGNEYLSVTRFLKTLSQSFEDTPAYKLASEETRALWAEKRDTAANHGTNIHGALELYNATGQILEENKHLAPAIRSITDVYKEYNKTYDEICLYDKEYMIAGTTDKICAISNRKDCEVDIADFKTNLKGHITFRSEYKKRLYPPLEHLQDCDYTKYCLQLSIYAFFFERLTGRKVRNIFVHFVPPNDMLTHHKVQMPYLKTDVKMLLDAYRDKNRNLVVQLNEQGEF